MRRASSATPDPPSQSSARWATPRGRRPDAAGLGGLAVLISVLLVGLLWSKWVPYWGYMGQAGDDAQWPGTDVFEAVGGTVTLEGAWAFTLAYFSAVWKALLVAVLVAAVIDSMVPRDWMMRLMNRASSLRQSSMGALLSLPTMMCSCCAAPVASGLRRRGVSAQAALAYWVGNPLLNPVVLVFVLLLLPWEWGAVRILAGAALAVGASALIGRWVSGRGEGVPPPAAEEENLRRLPRGFLRSLVRFIAILIPGHVMLVFLIGLLSPYFSGLYGLEAQFGAAAVVLAAAVGTLLVIPTGGEIPIVLALIAAGAGTGMAGALLITLPALSAPSMALVIREMGWRATTAMPLAVLTAGTAAGLLLMTTS